MTERDDLDCENSGKSKSRISLGRILLITVISVLSLIVLAILIQYYVPDLVNRPKRRRSASAVGNLRTLKASQTIYLERRGEGKNYATLKDLEKAGFLDHLLGSGVRNEYRFDMFLYTDEAGAPKYCAKATPLGPNEEGDRYFFLDAAGVIYFSMQDFTVNKKNGQPSKLLTKIGGQ